MWMPIAKYLVCTLCGYSQPANNNVIEILLNHQSKTFNRGHDNNIAVPLTPSILYILGTGINRHMLIMCGLEKYYYKITLRKAQNTEQK